MDFQNITKETPTDKQTDVLEQPRPGYVPTERQLER